MTPDDEQFPELGGEGGGLPPRDDNPFGDKAKILVRLVAAGFLLVGVLDLLACWFQARKDHTSLAVGRALVSCIPLVIGVFILIKTSAIARRIEDWLEQ